MKTPPFIQLHPITTSARVEASWLSALAAEYGLGVSAVTSADPMPELSDHLEAHIAAGHVAGFDWFTPERARFSSDPRNLHPTARSIVTVGIPYWSGAAVKPTDGPRGRISRYAWGPDYHVVLKRRMESLHNALELRFGCAIEARLLVDTARIVDRAFAARAGLGWYGKHSCLIVPAHGSWVMLGSMLLDIELEPTAPLDHDCGRCSICIDRCPTGAIVAPYTVDTPTCLSFQTIEQRGAIPRELRAKLGDWVFGCDVCQNVCPYTGAAAVVDDPDFRPANPDRAFPRLDWLLTMTEPEFREIFRGSAVLRTKRRGLTRNAAVALANSRHESAESLLVDALADHDEPLVRGHAAWGLGELGSQSAKRALGRALESEPDESVKQEIRSALESPA